MRRFKTWLMEKFLPAWAKEEYHRQLHDMEQENKRLREKVNRMEDYLAGMENALRRGRKIYIYTGRGEQEHD